VTGDQGLTESQLTFYTRQTTEFDVNQKEGYSSQSIVEVTSWHQSGGGGFSKASPANGDITTTAKPTEEYTLLNKGEWAQQGTGKFITTIKLILRIS